jgi:hypothetical protein
MFETIAQHLQALPLAVQLVALMIALSVADFAFAVIAALKNGTFHGTLFADWVTTKGLPIVTVALLYGLDGVLNLVKIDVGDTNLGAFGLLAYSQAITFIAQEAFSIVKNAKLFSVPPAGEQSDGTVPEG